MMDAHFADDYGLLLKRCERHGLRLGVAPRGSGTLELQIREPKAKAPRFRTRFKCGREVQAAGRLLRELAHAYGRTDA